MSELIPLYLAWLRAGGRSANTIRKRQWLLQHADQHLPYGVDNADPDEWAAYLGEPGWSAWTRATYYRHANGYYTWAVNGDRLTLNPLVGLIRPPDGDRIPDPATDAELAAALDLLPEQPWRMAVRLASWAGLRCCEIVTVRREDCTAEWLRVRGKGGKIGLVPMAPQLWSVIAPLPAGVLVVGARGRPLTAQMLTQMQHKVWRRIGQPGQHLHRFRHWCGTTIQRATGNIRVTQKVLRHVSVRSTEGYTMVSDAALHAAVAALPVPTTGAPAGQ